MTGTPQMHLCMDENLRIQDFSTDIQQTRGQHRNKTQERQGNLNIQKGVDILELDKQKSYLLNFDRYFQHFQNHRTGVGWSLSIRDSLEAWKRKKNKNKGHDHINVLYLLHLSN